jgi:hypothetical protein
MMAAITSDLDFLDIVNLFVYKKKVIKQKWSKVFDAKRQVRKPKNLRFHDRDRPIGIQVTQTITNDHDHDHDPGIGIIVEEEFAPE